MPGGGWGWGADVASTIGALFPAHEPDRAPGSDLMSGGSNFWAQCTSAGGPGLGRKQSYNAKKRKDYASSDRKHINASFNIALKCTADYATACGTANG